MRNMISDKICQAWTAHSIVRICTCACIHHHTRINNTVLLIMTKPGVLKSVVGYWPIMPDCPFIHSVNTLIETFHKYILYSHNLQLSTCSCNYTKKLHKKIYKVHIWQVAGYLTDSNVLHNIASCAEKATKYLFWFESQY